MASATSFALRSARSKLPQMLGSDLLSQLPETFVRSLVSPVGVALAADKAAQGGWRLDVPSELRADPPVSSTCPTQVGPFRGCTCVPTRWWAELVRWTDVCKIRYAPPIADNRLWQQDGGRDGAQDQPRAKS